MHSELAEHLEAATERTFEQLGFLFASPMEGAPAGSSRSARARVGFKGPRQGALELAVEVSVLEALTENLVGLEGESSVDEALEEDCLLEAANVICGNVLALMGEAGEPYLLSAPELLPAGELHTAEGGEETRLFLDVGEGWVGVRLTFLAPGAALEGLAHPRAGSGGAP